MVKLACLCGIALKLHAQLLFMVKPVYLCGTEPKLHVQLTSRTWNRHAISVALTAATPSRSIMAQHGRAYFACPHCGLAAVMPLMDADRVFVTGRDRAEAAVI